MLKELPPVTVVTIICAVAGAVLFISGYFKGFKASVEEFYSGATFNKEDNMKLTGLLIPLIFFGAASVIALIGVHPIFMKLAPFLSIASAVMLGLLFYIEPHLD